jgi:LacI family transcriptional regulator, galactose operon repressor
MATTPQQGSYRATAQDVADLAGVSRSSVSLVLNGHAKGNVSAAKQQAVLEAASQLSYRPNALALSLRSRRSWILGVLTWSGIAGFPQKMLHAALDTAVGAGYLTMLMDIPDGVDAELRGVTALLDRQVDGIVVVAPELTEYEVPEALAGVQTILINCFDPDSRVTSIVPDELGAAACATQILIDRGHTRISLLADERSTVEANHRVDGARRASADAGLELTELVSPEASAEGGFVLVRAAL